MFSPSIFLCSSPFGGVSRLRARVPLPPAAKEPKRRRTYGSDSLFCPLRRLALSGEAPEFLRAPLARLAECYSPPAGPPCRTPCRTAAGRRGTLPLNFCGTSFFSTFVERIVDVVGFTGASSGEKRRLKPPERRLPTQLSTEGAKPCWSSPRRGRRGPHLPHGQTAEAPPPGGMDHLPSPSQTMYPRGAPPYLSTMPRRCRPPACR